MEKTSRFCIACNTKLEQRPDEFPSRFAIRLTCNAACARRASAAGRTRPIKDRFWEKVDVRGPDDCWEWAAHRHRQGYGMVSLNGRAHTAQRVAWQLANGPIPARLHVLHHCDNPPCCNPAHLFLGTVADNMRDRDLKGRRVPLRGMDSPLAKLTDEQIAEIRRIYREGAVSQRALAKRFGVSQTQVGRILRGESR